MPKRGLSGFMGTRIRMRRLEQGMGLEELAREAHLSIAYLSELERGKKQTPTKDYVHRIADCLGVGPDWLLEDNLNSEFNALLSDLGIRFKVNWRESGIDCSVLLELLEHDKPNLRELIQTFRNLLISLGLSPEEVLDEWLRARLALHGEYWQDMEKRALGIKTELGLIRSEKISKEKLCSILEARGVRIRVRSLPVPPGRHDPLRSVFIPEDCTLNLHTGLDESHQIYAIAREVMHLFLDHPTRSYTFPRVMAHSLGQAQADYDASYLAACLLMDRYQYARGLTRFFKQSDPSKALRCLQDMLLWPETISPEVFFYRLAQLLHTEFNIECYFMAMENSEPEGAWPFIRVSSRLFPVRSFLTNLNPYEHQCRRWQTVKLLMHEESGTVSSPKGTLRLQHSYFPELSQGLLNISIRLPHSHPTRVLTIGITDEDAARAQIAFLQSPSLEHQEVGESCETCGLYIGCSERVEDVARPSGRSTRQHIVGWEEQLIENLKVWEV